MNLKKHISHKVFKVISDVAEQDKLQAFVIGGYVRDILLERKKLNDEKDIDIVVAGSGMQLATDAAKELGNIKVSVFKNFGTAMFKYDNIDWEFVGARKESYREHSRKPIVEDGTLEDDQNRRDFTINALAISLNHKSWGALEDPFNGLQDLENRTLRTPLDPDITYSDDPLRMMRAIRFVSQLSEYGFKIEEESYKAIKRNTERIKIVSQERITDELNKIVLSPKPSVGFKLLFNTGLLQIIFPKMCELHGVEEIDGKRHKDNFYHTLQVLDNIAENTDNLWLRWAAIMHDIAKPDTKRFDKDHGWTFHGHEERGARMVPKLFRQLKLPLDQKMKFVQKLVRLHLRPIALVNKGVTDSAARRLLFDAGDDIDDLMTLCHADITSKNEKKVERYHNNFKKVYDWIHEVEEKDRVKNWQPPVSGEIIMNTFGLKPGKEIGIIKNAIKEAVLDGHVENNYEATYQFMLEKGKELGLQQKK